MQAQTQVEALNARVDALEEALGLAIRQLVNEDGWSQQATADMLGISRHQVRRLLG